MPQLWSAARRCVGVVPTTTESLRLGGFAILFSRNRCERAIAIAIDVMIMAASAAATPIASGNPSAPTPAPTSSPSTPAADPVPSPSPQTCTSLAIVYISQGAILAAPSDGAFRVT